MNPLISIVIPNWNGKTLLERCLPSLSRLNYPNFEVIVVDNGSGDDSIGYVQSSFSHFRVIQLRHNTGFAHAVNVGIQASSGDYIALLNNDTEVDPKWLTELLIPFSQTKSIGIVASKLLNFYQRDTIDSAGDVLNIVGQGYAIGGGEKDGAEWNNGCYIFSGTGGASLYKRAVFNDIGFFEETFFMYFEDVDLSYRAQRFGYTIWYQPTAVVYHIQKASSNRSKASLEYLLYRNFVINYLINTPRALFYRRYSLLKFCMVFVHTFYYQTRMGYVGAAIKTWLWLLSHIPLIIKLRNTRTKLAKPEVSDEYIESFIIDKKIKILSFRF
ncbi:MAG: glycosyltransferase family 2 protein [bacterium]|nr:glycosyltransferase family 2 protein [bacterium]